MDEEKLVQIKLIVETKKSASCISFRKFHKFIKELNLGLNLIEIGIKDVPKKNEIFYEVARSRKPKEAKKKHE